MKRITLKILDMECPNCAMLLEQIEGKLAGVQTAEASYHKGQMVVEFNELYLDEETIRAEIARMGYQVGDQPRT